MTFSSTAPLEGAETHDPGGWRKMEEMYKKLILAVILFLFVAKKLPALPSSGV